MRILVETEGRFALDPGEDLEAIIDRVMGFLLVSPVEDPDVSGSLATGDVTFTMVVEAATPKDAIGKADDVVLAALQAADINTPNWESTSARRLEPVGA